MSKIKAEMRVKPEFDATSISTLDGGTVFPVKKSEWVLPTSATTGDWGSAPWTFEGASVTSTSTSTTLGKIVAAAGGTYKLSGTSTSTSPWWLMSDMPKWQRDIIIDVICEEIVGR
jgi:hypothetical protein